MKKIMPVGAWIVGLGFTVFLFFAVIQNMTNDRFTVTHFAEHVREGYEAFPAITKIDVSPQLAWKDVGFGWKLLGFLSFAALWLGVFYVGTNRHLGKHKRNPDGTLSANDADFKGGEARGTLAILVPLILCLVFFFGGYSTRVANNYEEVAREHFDQWEKEGVIKKVNEKKYVDAKGSNTLKSLFDRDFIQ
jgi:hypothetical protein